MKRFGLAAVVLLMVLSLAPAAEAATAWTARLSGHGLATLRVGSPARLVLGLTSFRAGSTYTVTLRRGSCASTGSLVLSKRMTATSSGRIARTVTLTTTQTRAARLPLALRVGSRCATFAQSAPAPLPPGVFGDGTWRTGTTAVPAGTYRTAGSASCYWARLSGFGGTSAEIIANAFGAGPMVATIAASDVGFTSSRCGTWRLDAPAVPTASPGDGIWRVGIDVQPGTYTATGESCYWARLSGFSGDSDEIIANDIVTGPGIVTIDPTDAGFESSRCGAWTLIP
jgi:hypothetical protein